MRDLRACVLVLPLIAGCSFDFTGFASGASGTSGSAGTSASGPSGSASTSSGAGGNASATSSGSGATTTSTSTTGGAGGAGVLTQCGGFQDSFSTLDSAKWSSFGTVSNMAGHTHTKIPNNGGTAEVSLKPTAQFDECYASTRIFDYDPNAYLRVEEGTNVRQIAYDKPGNALSTPGLADMDPGFDPDALGLVFHAGQVHFLYFRDGDGWTHAGSIPRDAWMNNGANDTIALGAGPANFNDQAAFDDYNVIPITLADLP